MRPRTERRLMRQFVSILLFAIVVVAAACTDSNAPARSRVTQPIFNIKVPAAAGPSDSIRISFNYSPGACDSALALEVRPSYTEALFAVSSIPTNQVCPYGLPIARIVIPVVYVVPPPHALPYTARFAEPGEADSVRVVAAAP